MSTSLSRHVVPRSGSESHAWPPFYSVVKGPLDAAKSPTTRGTSSSPLEPHPRAAAYGGGAMKRRLPAPLERRTGPAVGGGKNSLAAIPAELLLAILILVVELDGRLSPISILSVVCRQWNRLCNEPFLWDCMAKRFFVAYPLVHRLTDGRRRSPTPMSHSHSRSPSLSSSSVSGAATPAPLGKGAAADTRGRACSLSEGGFTNSSETINPRSSHRPSRRSFLSHLAELSINHIQQSHQHYVHRRRGPVLHAMLSGALFCFFMAGLVAMLGLEGIETVSAAQCFGFLWGTYTFSFGAVIANIVMEAHFEPQPLLSRIRRHIGLIMKSCAVLVVSIACIALPLFLVQRNVFRAIDAIQAERWADLPSRGDWLFAAAPILSGLSLWLLEVLYSVRDQYKAWLARNAPLTFTVLYDAGAYCTPVLFIIAILSAVEATVNPHSTIHLVVGTAPLFVTFATLTIVFVTEYSVHGRFSDLCTSISLALASAFPLAIVLFPLRGWTLLPLVLASFGFYLCHLNGMRRTMFMLESGELLLDEDETEPLPESDM